MSQKFIKPTSVKDVLGVIGYAKPTPLAVMPLRLTNVGSVAMPVTIKGIDFTADIEYNLNGSGWTHGTGTTVQPGEYIEFRGHNETLYNQSLYCSQLNNSLWQASGSIMSLVYGDSLNETNNTELPPTAESIFAGFFENCTNLTTPPELPSLNVPSLAYYKMFQGCSSLIAAPELPATILADGCYYSMFVACTSLTTAPELPATTLADGCYNSMFYGCTSLTTAPELPATTLADSCYSSMFDGCTNLTTAPELPATTLAAYCYNYMFDGCTSLAAISVAFTSWDVENSTTEKWLKDVSATGSFVCPAALDMSIRDASHIPAGWTVETY